MLFTYKAKDSKGLTVEGTIEAMSQDAALKLLSEKKMIVLSLEDLDEKPFWKKEINIPFLNRVGPRDLVFLSRQISVMVTAGLPLVESLDVLKDQTDNAYLKKIIENISKDVQGGLRFSSSLAKYPKIFDDFFINMVRAGETAGNLDEVLRYLADEQEKNFDLMNKIKGAMVYPIFVIATVIGVMVLMMVFVIPQLTEILAQSSVELPLPTKILIAVSNFLKAFYIYIILFLIALAIGARFLLKTREGQLFWGRVVIRLPVFGALFQKLYLVRFARSLSTLLIGGIPLTSALRIVSDVVGNVVYKNIILQSINDVEGGHSVSEAFLDNSAVPVMLPRLMIVGEQTGKLDEVLEKVSAFYAREIENMLGKLVTLLEPIIIIFLGLVVAGMAASILLPMYQLSSAF
ncbi:type II secretion system F family protein [Patescibacteria group bacterium]|nr:type II secretion system F family protein [Patescibacteria group bacterium]